MSAASLLRGPLIGTCLASVLYGITCLQAFFYFQTYVNDQRGLKLTVALLLTLEDDPCCSVDYPLITRPWTEMLIVTPKVDYGSYCSSHIPGNRSSHVHLCSRPRLLLEYVNSPLVGGTPSDERLQFLIDLVVYFYFTWRIWMFTSNLWIVFFMVGWRVVMVAATHTPLVDSDFTCANG
ncbi:hypothetical protein EDC04DRAFT_2617248 [Pisolithus marmoratus]|nr:hypothetical protein EDC04DRAFT_2617248 [Pisolithus marmoratus]